ncbi:hypothetical protein [Sideroxydans lithotrophicus]|uniref:Uncharacterized protein n=1 Tax=Sideroxydans lithotrophicus (strain ES-1) TaxID=580332 RepID=D5CRI5_SIDLE|nr:hypothetical protein [Sideroxydans lithotrophicus]ADE11571.1 hypothetical protein Slit_1334 [Sideroxydans lithotrophicus ES-1]
MKDQQSYSHGLLLSVEPEDISTLHLVDEESHNEFSWPAYRTSTEGKRTFQMILDFLKIRSHRK